MEPKAHKEEHSFGFVVVYREESEDQFLLVKHVDGHWGFPKGHPEPGETPTETALRELKEECSVTEVRVVPGRTFSETYTFERANEVIRKTNTFFLGFVKSKTVISQESEISECWFATYEDVGLLQLFPDTKRILREAHDVLCLEA